MRGIGPILAMHSLLLCALLAGCRSNSVIGSQSQQTAGNSSVVLAMTDTPPSNVSIISAKVTLTGATLTPGNAPLFSGSTQVDLMRLQTDVAYLVKATNVPAGNYTGVTLTFANPSLTIENDTAAKIVSGSTTCDVGAICTIAPTSTPILSANVAFFNPFSLAADSTAGLLIDVDLDEVLSSSLGADFSAGTTATPFTPAGVGAPPVGAEDVVGQVSSVSASANSFKLQNSAATYTLKVDSASTFFQFPNSVCASPGFACLQNNQILSVDIGIQSDGSLQARNLVFEDADSSDVEVEGMITSTNAGSQQFDIVIQSLSAMGSVLTVGQAATVQYSASPQTPFDIDLVHVDSVQASTSGFLFATPADLAVGQEVSIRLHGVLSGGQLQADRVRLRSSRLTATVQSIGLPHINLFDLPSVITGHGGITQIIAQTLNFPATIYFEVGRTINSSSIAPNLPISVRGPLFNVNGGRTMLATKVVLAR